MFGDLVKSNVLGVGISQCSYASATDAIVEMVRRKRGGLVTACAVHLIMECQTDDDLRQQINDFDIVTPDGQPVRWALNWLDGALLRDRVYGPDLTLYLCRRAESDRLNVFLYGSTESVVRGMSVELRRQFPHLEIVGIQPSRFRPSTAEEDASDVEMIERSGADLVFVGLGCPLQERWSHEHRQKLSAVMVCVGAAFDFHAGTLKQAPRWMQRAGLEWAFRLSAEPKRLWRRYLYHNPRYLAGIALQWLGSNRR
jgi:N-acetylglucosaminyldiphosphoundecaprenol N-acetyl-beta-D-mannosaminyltransferase